MASVSDSVPHIVRTAKDPRQQSLFNVKVSEVDQVNSFVRLIQLELPKNGEHPATNLTISYLLTIVKQPTFTHLPGQWLDVHVPFIPQAGGFTITSAPLHAEEGHNGRKHLELAIRKSPNNPPAAFFWQPKDKILGTLLQVRIGGRFVYPPPHLSEKEALDIKRIVFVAGGVGINPIMSMLEHLDLESHLDPARVRSLRLLYGTRAKPIESILFYERIARILGKHLKSEPTVAGAGHDYRATMYLTGGTKESLDEVSRHKMLENEPIEHKYRRVNHTDLTEALGPVAGRKDTVAYVCGPPRMTDEFVEILSRVDGMDPRRVFCEKWW